MKRAWHKLIARITGKQGKVTEDNIDQLLSDLGQYVMRGENVSLDQYGSEEGNIGGNNGNAFASAKFRLPEEKKEESKEEVNYKQINRFKETPRDIVKLPDGSLDFGFMPETKLNNGETLPSAPFRLLRGRDNMGMNGSGYVHIEIAHGDEIRRNGYYGVQDFVWDLVNRYSEIWKGDRGTILLVAKKGGGKSAGFVELQNNDGFYIVKTAFPARVGYPENSGKQLLWRRDTHAFNATDKQNPFSKRPQPEHTSAGQQPTAPDMHNKVGSTLVAPRGQSNKENIAQNENDDNTSMASLAFTDPLTGRRTTLGKANEQESSRYPDN